jgi:hypothetical protein
MVRYYTSRFSREVNHKMILFAYLEFYLLLMFDNLRNYSFSYKTVNYSNTE